MLDDQLARFRVSTIGVLEPELRRWALSQIARGMSGSERVEARDGLLREAGELLGGTIWHRATRIARIAAGRLEHPAGELVREAGAFASVPRSTRQLLRCLGDDSGAVSLTP